VLALVPGIADAAKFAEPLRIVNMTLHYCLIFTAMITLVECYKQLRRLLRVRNNAVAASTTV
jgi:hypothetical protein